MACSYRDLLGFLLGDVAIEDFRDGSTFLEGGIGAMSCIEGLAFAPSALRKGAMRPDARQVVLAAIETIVGDNS